MPKVKAKAIRRVEALPPLPELLERVRRGWALPDEGEMALFIACPACGERFSPQPPECPTCALRLTVEALAAALDGAEWRAK